MEFLDTAFLRDGEITLKLTRTTEEDRARGWLPAYQFAICLADGTEAGRCELRLGYNANTYYGGNIGYSVDPAHRGRHYAGKACKLLFSLARKRGMEYLIITCDPDNAASRKTCEYAGGTLEEIVDLPEDNDMYRAGARKKCVYRVQL